MLKHHKDVAFIENEHLHVPCDDTYVRHSTRLSRWPLGEYNYPWLQYRSFIYRKFGLR